MLYWLALAIGVIVAGAGWVVFDRRRKRRHEDHVARRADRQRRRIMEWTILEWLYGRRGNLRLTHRQQGEPGGSGAVGED